MTLPARLPGHMELKPFACICCLCIHANLHHLSILIRQIVPVGLVVTTMFLLYSCFCLERVHSRGCATERKRRYCERSLHSTVPPSTGPHIVAGQWTYSQCKCATEPPDVVCCTVSSGCCLVEPVCTTAGITKHLQAVVLRD